MTQRHLQSCAQCRADLAWQRRLRASTPAPDAAFDADRGFAQLLPRLGLQSGPQPLSLLRVGVLHRWRKAAAANSAWLKWTAVAQLAAIGVLSLTLARHGHDDAGYRALGAARVGAGNDAGNAVVVFRPDTLEREMRRILKSSSARVVDGPTVTDAYLIALPASQVPAALARMRMESAVTLAQPLTDRRQP
jgi:hypothetical protein